MKTLEQEREEFKEEIGGFIQLEHPCCFRSDTIADYWLSRITAIVDNIGKGTKILGRELTLADVLLAIGKIRGLTQIDSWDCVCGDYTVGKLLDQLSSVHWNLKLPYSQQSVETRLFLANLLK